MSDTPNDKERDAPRRSESAKELRIRHAAENAAYKLRELGREFNSPNFTDRYGDGPACVDLAKKLLEAINE